ncbi:thiopeptide-type bacteriocin biosynthesis protein [Streptomyces sp. NPDC051018]|uniref:thiopeptide-type bacteriocin biosynthesis protein n=1 Tax=Streptomyces sp. NPDC051018 TaxID=3365639 RepID=UPI0037BC30F8
MSSDRLTRTDPSQATEAVLDVLAGTPVSEAARKADMDPADLTDAVELFRCAGTEALQSSSADSEWWQVNLHFANWRMAEFSFLAAIMPLLRTAEAAGDIDGWWYTRKHPCWRLRIRLTSTDSAARTTLAAGFDRLTAPGGSFLKRWWTGIYEPETTAFGGPAGMTAAHRLFVADSREIPRIDDRHDIPLGRRELSVLLCTLMMRAAGLEWYEQADVWHRVITDEHRIPVNPIPPEKLEAITEDIGTLLRADHDSLLCPGGSLEPIKEWVAAFGETGRSLAEAVRLGTLDRGLRRILSLHVIFHWNRMGLTMHSQGVLALTARTAILGPSQDSSRPPKTSSGE